MNTHTNILLLFSIFLILPVVSIFGFGIAYGSTDPLVLEQRKQFNAEHGCDYLDMKILALVVETGIGQLTDKCHIYYYDCLVALKTVYSVIGKSLMDVIDEKIKEGIPLEKWCK